MARIDLTPEHRQQLANAKRVLENPGLAARITNIVGKPIELGIEALPQNWQDGIVGVTSKALEVATDAALWSIDSESSFFTGDILHKAAVTATGMVGGAFGLPALAVELPISTTIMLRSIADIARCEGENLSAPESKLQCMTVFALGGHSPSDDAIDSAYYVARYALGKAVSEAAKYVATGGAQAAAPAMVRFITTVAARFQVQVTQKAAAQAAPIFGAAGGALINNLFMSHFQDLGRAHFTVRRLERTYTAEVINGLYLEL